MTCVVLKLSFECVKNLTIDMRLDVNKYLLLIVMNVCTTIYFDDYVFFSLCPFRI